MCVFVIWDLDLGSLSDHAVTNTIHTLKSQGDSGRFRKYCVQASNYTLSGLDHHTHVFQLCAIWERQIRVWYNNYKPR